MGCMLRSDKLTFCEMYLQPEAAHKILSKLGEIGCVQFEDMNPDLTAFQRHYTSELCRCTEMERVLNYIEVEINKESLPMFPVTDEPPSLKPDELNSFENLMEKWEEDLKEMGKYQSTLIANQQQLHEMSYVLKNIDPILGQSELRRESLVTRATTLGAADPALGGKLYVSTGVVPRSRAYNFEIMLWRISRGNVFIRPANKDQLFEDPNTGTSVRKVAFVAVCQGDTLKSTFDKICTAFRVNLYSCPPTYALREAMINKIDERISDLTQVIEKSKYHRCKQLRYISKIIDSWAIRVKKAKGIYYCMNLFSMDITRKCLIGQCWIPTDDLKDVQKILDTGSTTSGSKVASFLSKVDTVLLPPTYHRTNKFTRAFQNLIGAYGDSIYGELNPGLYTIITFPFLFAVMFGDCGHGCIMLSFATWMVLKEKTFLRQKSTNEIWNIFFGGRYVILMMSIFTMYTGFVYNDWFSKPLRLKSSYWLNVYTPEILSQEAILQLDPAGKTGERYMLGVDPAWGFSLNKIMYENSMKMKLSIIVGIVHMMFGVWLSVVNHIYFKKYYAIFLEFLPQLLILTCLFAWLVFLVFLKWVMYAATEKNIKYQPACAPSILILFIDMCLFRGTKLEEGSECDAYMFDSQELIQKILVLVTVASIPVLLFGSPIYLVISNKQKLSIAERNLYKYQKRKSNLAEYDKIEQHLIDEVHHYSESFAELMIHQGVHTIEYVLSTISHTASYLRLWALSLAHAQLSEMLWIMIFSQLALSDHSWIGSIKIFVIFAIWASFSLAILVVMEGLSAFLHTLRLHWVEFMSKFFVGGGELFRPYNFYEIIYGDNKDEKAMESACKKKKDKK